MSSISAFAPSTRMRLPVASAWCIYTTLSMTKGRSLSANTCETWNQKKRGLIEEGGQCAPVARRKTHLVALNFAFGVIFKVSVAFVPSFHNLTELVCECGVEEMVHA